MQRNNYNTVSSLLKQKQIDEQVKAIGKWVNDVQGHDVEEVIEFIKKNLYNLNDNTKKSIYEHILTISKTDLIEINKKKIILCY